MQLTVTVLRQTERLEIDHPGTLASLCLSKNFALPGKECAVSY